MIPTETTDDYWVYYGNSSSVSSERKDLGKWMLFYHKSKLDSKWVELCDLYDKVKLTGILYMKCSTAKKNLRSSNDGEGVIILYCNNSSNETEILKIGKGLMPYIQDYLGTSIYYKTDIQTRAGTFATGTTTNHTYKITIENPIVITSYPLPFFPDYTIDIPSSYNGGRDLTGITIKNKKGNPVNPKGIPTGSIAWILKNPDSTNSDYQKLYKKNVIGTSSQSLYDSDIRAIYKYLKVSV